MQLQLSIHELAIRCHSDITKKTVNYASKFASYYNKVKFECIKKESWSTNHMYFVICSIVWADLGL